MAENEKQEEEKIEETKTEDTTAESSCGEGCNCEPETKKKKKKDLHLMQDAGKMAKGFFADFKAFISKGNVFQLAVAFIMGAAFTAIVNSLVGDFMRH